MALPKLTTKILQYMREPKVRSIGRRPTLYPSQARAETLNGPLGTCLRSAYWSKTGEPKTNEVSDAVMLMAHMGNAIEDGLIDICKNMGMWVANNVKWYNEAENVSGEIDVIIDMPDTETGETIRVNVECKSCTGYYVNKEVFGYSEGRGKNRRYIPGRPKDKHLMQSALYADVTRGKCAGTLVIYFSRDESKMTQFLVTVDEEGVIYIDGRRENRFTIKDIYASYRKLQEALDSESLPGRDYKPVYTDNEVGDLYGQKAISKTAYENHLNKKKEYRDKNCEYCNYLDKCLNMEQPAEVTPDFLAHGSF